MTFRYESPSGPVSVTVSQSADGNFESDAGIAANATVAEVVVPIDISKTLMLLLSSDTDMTLKTNSSGSPTDTITLTGGVPIFWQTGMPNCPITADVTKFFVANGAAAGTLKIRVLTDTTI